MQVRSALFPIMNQLIRSGSRYFDVFGSGTHYPYFTTFKITINVSINPNLLVILPSTFSRTRLSFVFSIRKTVNTSVSNMNRAQLHPPSPLAHTYRRRSVFEIMPGHRISTKSAESPGMDLVALPQAL